MWVLLMIELLLIALFILMGWAIKKKKVYWIISGFNTRPKDEQEKLIEKGLPQKTGTLMYIIGFGMLCLLPLLFTPFKYAMEVQFGFMLVVMMGGLIYLSKYELPKKRKMSYITSISLSLFLLLFVGGIAYLGYQDFNLEIKEESFEISGVYGDEWSFEEIEKIELMEEMPEVTARTNGFGMSGVSKGYFTVTDYGKSLLFIEHGISPYLYIKLNDKQVFINSINSQETENWYKQLKKKQSKSS